jgi:ribosomal-protein-alanine N-acetyltransferase
MMQATISIYEHRLKTLSNENLTLVAATASHLQVELKTPDQLSELLEAEVSNAWPSGEYDRDAMEFFYAQLQEGGEAAEGWYGWYAIRHGDQQGPRALVGAGGFMGPPSADGVVEIGYSVLPEWQGKQYATAIVGLLLDFAFDVHHVNKVIAHTDNGNEASIKVLLNNGFVADGTGEDSRQLRFARWSITNTDNQSR